MWVPVAATAFLLVSGSANNQDVPYRFLSFKPLRGIGEISYSMYLWHWPIFVFGTEAGLMDQLWQRFVGIGLTIVLAIATYFLVEKPFLSIPIKRVVPQSAGSSSPFKRRQIQLASAAAAVVGFVVVLGVTYPTALGLPDASSETQAQGWKPPVNIATSTRPTQGSAVDKTGSQLLTERQALLRKSLGFVSANSTQKQAFIEASYTPETKAGWWVCQSPAPLISSCDAGRPQAKRLIVIIGSSYTQMWSSAFRQITFDHPDIRAHFFAVGSCSNSLNQADMVQGVDTAARREACAYMHSLALDYLKSEKPEQVVFASHLGAIGPTAVVPYLKGAKQFFDQASKYADSVTLLGVSPNYPDPKVCLNRNLTNLNACGALIGSDAQADFIQRSLLQQSNWHFVNPMPWFCVDGQCPLYLGNTIAAAAPFHISREAALITAPLLYDALFVKK